MFRLTSSTSKTEGRNSYAAARGTAKGCVLVADGSVLPLRHLWVENDLELFDLALIIAVYQPLYVLAIAYNASATGGTGIQARTLLKK